MINNIFVFSIGLTWDPDVCWSLPDGEHHTPVGHFVMSACTHMYLFVDYPWISANCPSESVEFHCSGRTHGRGS
jgi:hypothetical protein